MGEVRDPTLHTQNNSGSGSKKGRLECGMMDSLKGKKWLTGRNKSKSNYRKEGVRCQLIMRVNLWRRCDCICECYDGIDQREICNVDLGGDWSRKHGPVGYDYEGMKVTVFKDGKRMILKALIKAATHQAKLQMISARSMKRLIQGGQLQPGRTTECSG
ncbi:hypothetical protein Salat_1705800 [Sesamum alatum]|uniref:Uncharacterized protein n=1 Tax=Sesamum alatum TaxID=300844 RepID=A0AAE2CKB4_9LAMI|nr:hypothetical protein Salat_1705800 [Sesamum alatum]